MSGKRRSKLIKLIGSLITYSFTRAETTKRKEHVPGLLVRVFAYQWTLVVVTILSSEPCARKCKQKFMNLCGQMRVDSSTLKRIFARRILTWGIRNSWVGTGGRLELDMDENGGLALLEEIVNSPFERILAAPVLVYCHCHHPTSS